MWETVALDASQVAISFVFFRFIYDVISPFLSSFLSSYNNLTADKKAEWHSRTTSSVHAVIVTITCVYVMLTDDELANNKIWGQSWIVKSNTAMIMGYFLSDLYIVKTDLDAAVAGDGVVLHHSIGIFSAAYMLTYRVLMYFANFRAFAELSTPFVNLRWHLDVTGRKNTRGYIYNGLAMVATFFIARILVMPYFYYLIYTVYGTEEFERLGFMTKILWVLLCVVLDVMNTKWFCKMLRGAYKVLSKKKSN